MFISYSRMMTRYCILSLSLRLLFSKTIRAAKLMFPAAIGVRAGGARRAAAPPNFGQLRFFGQQEKIWAKPGFKDVPLFFYCYFEEINILYFILTKILTSVGVIIKLHSLET